MKLDNLGAPARSGPVLDERVGGPAWRDLYAGLISGGEFKLTLLVVR